MVRVDGRTGLVAVLLATLTLSACADELAQAIATIDCDEAFAFEVTETPSDVIYEVVKTGPAVVSAITYTLPGGDETVTNPALPFRLDTTFDDPASARLRVIGEAAAGGEIGLGFILFAPDPMDDQVASTFCLG